MTCTVIVPRKMAQASQSYNDAAQAPPPWRVPSEWNFPAPSIMSRVAARHGPFLVCLVCLVHLVYLIRFRLFGDRNDARNSFFLLDLDQVALRE